MPLYRQAQIYARQGIALDRSTLADWVGRAAWHLRPIHERLLEHIRSSAKIFADETTARVLDPGHGRTKSSGRMRPTTGHSGASIRRSLSMFMAQNQKSERPIAHLAGFTSDLQVDGYRALAEKNSVQLAFCWSHVRWRFGELGAARRLADRQRAAGAYRPALCHRERDPRASRRNNVA